MTAALLRKATNTVTALFTEARDKFNSPGHTRIRELVTKFKKKTETIEGLVASVASQLYIEICDDRDEATTVALDILSYAKRKWKKHPERCRLLLFAAVDILATFNVQDRNLVRTLLKMLFNYFDIIDREVFLFRYAKCRHFSVPRDDPELDAKQTYILSMTAGWKIPQAGFVRFNIRRPPTRHYLEHRFRSDDSISSSPIMAEALYRLQNPSMVLKLLQHGVYPSSVFLWPISVVLEMMRKLKRDVGPKSYEMTVIRYFCRARNHFKLSVLPYKALIKGRVGLLVTRFMQYTEPSDDVLLVSQHVKSLYPAERHSEPAELRQHCRTAIRRQLLDVDNLPRGISRLGLPGQLQRYLSLLVD